jgi:hypothetical protein
MFDLRQFIRSGLSSRFLALWIAYSLAIQALMASVGLGMSAFAASGDHFLICSHASGSGPVSTGDHQNRNPSLPCPFCFVAAQSAGHVSLLSAAPAFPVYAHLPATPASNHIGDGRLVPKLYRIVGAPRGPPPTFSD